MKLITLNIWGGHVYHPLLEFIKLNKSVDIFCFQEVYSNASYKTSTDERSVSLNIFSELQDILTEHNGFFVPAIENIYGICVFIKKDIEIIEQGSTLIHDNPEYTGIGPTHPRVLQWLKCKINDQLYTIINIHGLWNGKGKTDTSERIIQSQRIRAFIDSVTNTKIVCGDFNLRPDTESLAIIEKGLINLIKQYNITSTRTSFYNKEEKFADYILTSPEIKINDFKVLKDEVSDHSPLLLDFGC